MYFRNVFFSGNEDLMARLCKEVIATGPWMEIDSIQGEHSLGSITTFFASGILFRLLILVNLKRHNLNYKMPLLITEQDIY